ncbi:unnamed protein product [Cylindrotheca closterium]|uniref:Chalcone isomerase domain-containing protein n=1 Tax=Cylindrotheca closterium TaxID=2856 RepID=A0AAD2JHI6_9STRA|nr:unnamed protein product [Cylindrotheca closterium]
MNLKIFLLIVLLQCWSSEALKKEPRTGIVFPDPYQSKRLQKTGVRTKGPIKVYAIGQYDDTTFLLHMTYGVGAEKMTDALKDALEPRLSNKNKNGGDGSTDEELKEFEQLMLKGLPKGASKGTQLTFGTGGGKLSLQVNGKQIGTIKSKPLSKAFAGIYTDRKAVCTLKPPAVEEGAANDGEGTIDSIFGIPKKRLLTVAGAALVGSIFGTYI